MMNNPELFRENNRATRTATVDLLKEYTTKINWRKDSDSAIDIGSADGSVTSLIKQQIPSKNVKFVGCDISEAMVKFAKEHHGGENISFRVFDITGDLPNDLKSEFNHVFSFFTLNCVLDQEKAFKNIYNLLTEGGDILLAFVQSVPIYDMLSHVAQDTKWSSSWLKNIDQFISPYYKMQEPQKKITLMMENIGFTDIDVTLKTIVYSMTNGLEIKNLMKAVQPFNIPNDVFEDLAMDCVPVAQDIGILDKTDKSFDDHNKPIQYKYTLLVVSANKPLIIK